MQRPLPPQPMQPEPSAAKIHLGIKGLATIEIPIAPDVFGRIRRRLFPRWHEKIAAAGARVTFNVPHDDDGTGDIAIILVNFGRADVWVESITVDWISVGNGGLELQAAKLDGRAHLERTNMAQLKCRVIFGAGAIRDLQHALDRPANRYSSHRAAVGFAGTMTVTRGSQRATLSFAVVEVVPFLNLYNPSSRNTDA